MLLDVHRPSATGAPLPALVWVHGGGFVGGSKDELAGYFKLIASNGYAVVAPRYALAPEHRYPTPTRQVMHALGYLKANAERLGIDGGRIALAGDSAGAQIAAQIAALVTSPGTPTRSASRQRSHPLSCVASCSPAALTTWASPSRSRRRKDTASSPPSSGPTRAGAASSTTLFFADEHAQRLSHEYQFDLDTEAGRLFLERLVAFLGERLR